jgi:hypothetical protein
MQVFKDLETLVALVPEEKAMAISFKILQEELNRSVDSVVEELRSKGFFLAEDNVSLLIARSENIIDAACNGAEILELNEIALESPRYLS